MYGYNWEIAVSAGSYFPSLTYSFDGQDIQLAYENDDMGMQFFAYSRHIEGLSKPDEVAARLSSLQLLLNGALRVAAGGYYPAPISFLEFSSKSSGRHSAISNEFEVNPFVAQPARGPMVRHPVDAASMILNQSTHDSSLRQLLFLCGLISDDSPASRILSWGTLYRILDTLKFLAKDTAIDFKSLVDAEKIERFTAACNNMSVLGIFARHGLSANPPPTRILTNLDEAMDLLLKSARIVVAAYLKAKPSPTFVLPS